MATLSIGNKSEKVTCFLLANQLLEKVGCHAEVGAWSTNMILLISCQFFSWVVKPAAHEATFLAHLKQCCGKQQNCPVCGCFQWPLLLAAHLIAPIKHV
jgi:hypothetical protein